MHPRSLVAWLVAWAACGGVQEPPRSWLSPVEPPPVALVGEPLRPLPAAVPGDPREIALGRDLFFEPALSRDRTLTCASCHPFEHGGADPRARSIGLDGQATAVNSPSVFNLAFNHCYAWNGATCGPFGPDAAIPRLRRGDDRDRGLRDDLAEHALIPLGNVMGMPGDAAVAALAAEGDYAARFAEAYLEGLTTANIANALAAYERSLVTPNSPLDRYLLGDRGALGPAEQAGYLLFREVGCTSCHQGTNVGGNLFQRFGVVGDYLAERGLTSADDGRFKVTGREEDRRVFRVPSLRNVALTAPYFHDGSAETLAEAVEIMGRYQLGRDLKPDQIAPLVAFLAALTGDLPEAPGDD